MLEFKKGDKVIYLGSFPYKLANGQEVFNHGEEIIIVKDVFVQKKYFEKIVEEIKEVKNESKQKIQNKDKNKQ